MNYFIPQKPDKEVISIRLPSELLKQCILFAMEHLQGE